MSQIALVTDQHDDDVTVGVVPQLLEPPGDIFVGLVLADIVDQQCSNSSAVVGRSDGAVAFLTGGVPDLSLDGLCVDLDAAGGELNANGRLGVEVELVASETAQKVGFTDAGVSNQDDWNLLKTTVATCDWDMYL